MAGRRLRGALEYADEKRQDEVRQRLRQQQQEQERQERQEKREQQKQQQQQLQQQQQQQRQQGEQERQHSVVHPCQRKAQLSSNDHVIQDCECSDAPMRWNIVGCRGGEDLGHGGEDVGYGGEDVGHGGEDLGHGREDVGHGGEDMEQGRDSDALISLLGQRDLRGPYCARVSTEVMTLMPSTTKLEDGTSEVDTSGVADVILRNAPTLEMTEGTSSMVTGPVEQQKQLDQLQRQQQQQQQVQHQTREALKTFRHVVELNRKWIEINGGVTDRVELEFTIVNYNVSGRDGLQEEDLLKRELLHLHADILCLQCVSGDYNDRVLKPFLNQLEYEGYFVAFNGNEQLAGLATFFRTSRFRCHHHTVKDMEFSEILPKIDSSNTFVRTRSVLQITELVCLVGSSHHHLRILNFKLFDSDIHSPMSCVQVSRVMREAAREETATVICSDLGCRPDSQLYKLLSRGFISTHYDELWQGTPQYNLFQGGLRNLSRFSSAYTGFSTSTKNPLSRCDFSPAGLVLTSSDYIWMNKDLGVIGVLLLSDQWLTGTHPDVLQGTCRHAAIAAKLILLN